MIWSVGVNSLLVPLLQSSSNRAFHCLYAIFRHPHPLSREPKFCSSFQLGHGRRTDQHESTRVIYGTERSRLSSTHPFTQRNETRPKPQNAEDDPCTILQRGTHTRRGGRQLNRRSPYGTVRVVLYTTSGAEKYDSANRAVVHATRPKSELTRAASSENVIDYHCLFLYLIPCPPSHEAFYSSGRVQAAAAAVSSHRYQEGSALQYTNQSRNSILTSVARPFLFKDLKALSFICPFHLAIHQTSQPLPAMPLIVDSQIALSKPIHKPNQLVSAWLFISSIVVM